MVYAEQPNLTAAFCSICYEEFLVSGGSSVLLLLHQHDSPC